MMIETLQTLPPARRQIPCPANRMLANENFQTKPLDTAALRNIRPMPQLDRRLFKTPRIGDKESHL